MRKLSASQKKLLKDYLKDQVKKDQLQRFYDWDDLPYTLKMSLQTLNDFETLWVCTQHFLDDESCKIASKTKGVMIHGV